MEKIVDAIRLDVVPIQLAWDTVFSDETVHAYLLTDTLDCKRITDIMLTDTELIVPAVIDVLDPHMLKMTFNTAVIRHFSAGNNIYLFVVYGE